jgi:hypothetical protein
MTTTQSPAVQSRQRMTLGAGTALKIGFFGAFGAFLFMLIIYAILAVIGLIIFFLGGWDSLTNLVPN